MQVPSDPLAAGRALPATRPRRSLFFPAYAGLLLLTVLSGFAPSFYLRAWFSPSSLSPLLVLHGIALTAWFLLFFVQVLLAHRGQLGLHRQLGIAGAVVAAAVVASSLPVVFGIVHSWRAAGTDVEAQRQLLSMVVWGNLGALLAFSVLFVRGVLKRRQADAHKRLMLLASISIISPAISRIAFMPMFSGMDFVLLTVLGVLILLAILAMFDLATRRRLHVETLWGVPFFLLAHFGAVFLLPGTAMDTWLMARIWS